MRIWVFDHYASPPDLPVYARHYQFGRALRAYGHRVTVFASGFSHRTRREERLRGLQLYRRDHYDGMDFVWLRTVPYRTNGLWRLANMFSYLVCALVVQVRFRGPDVVVGTTVHPFAALAAQITARLRRLPFVLEISDLWPQTLVDLGALRQGGLAERGLRNLEAYLVKRAARVVSMLPGVGRYLRERSLPYKHVVVVPNGTDLAGRGRDPLKPGELHRTLSSWQAEGRVVFAYVGAHGRANRLEVILHAAHTLQQRGYDGIRILLVGDGPEKRGLIRLASDLSLRNVYLAAPVPYSQLGGLLSMTDVGLIHGAYSQVHRYGTSFNKLYEYWANSLPVVFALIATPDPVAEAGAGISVSPDSPDELADAMITMSEIPAPERQRFGINGRAHVEREYDLPARARLFEHTLLAATASDRRG